MIFTSWDTWSWESDMNQQRALVPFSPRGLGLPHSSLMGGHSFVGILTSLLLSLLRGTLATEPLPEMQPHSGILPPLQNTLSLAQRPSLAGGFPSFPNSVEGHAVRMAPQASVTESRRFLSFQ